MKILKKYPTSVHTRIGIVVPKKIAKTIVKRNLIKRKVRHIFIELLPRLRKGYDIVFLTREKFLPLTFQEMERKIVFILEKAQCII
jgi:ribonuclease P protein component